MDQNYCAASSGLGENRYRHFKTSIICCQVISQCKLFLREYLILDLKTKRIFQQMFVSKEIFCFFPAYVTLRSLKNVPAVFLYQSRSLHNISTVWSWLLDRNGEILNVDMKRAVCVFRPFCTRQGMKLVFLSSFNIFISACSTTFSHLQRLVEANKLRSRSLKHAVAFTIKRICLEKFRIWDEPKRIFFPSWKNTLLLKIWMRAHCFSEDCVFRQMMLVSPEDSTERSDRIDVFIPLISLKRFLAYILDSLYKLGLVGEKYIPEHLGMKVVLGRRGNWTETPEEK